MPIDQPSEARERASGFVPFTGRAQRLPDENPSGNLRANAVQRMQELGHQSNQARRGREMVDRMGDLGRALRRGGEQGDVTGLGKRKRANEFDPNPRRRQPEQLSTAITRITENWFQNDGKLVSS